MSPTVIKLLKLALVAGLMLFVFRQVPFQDKLEFRTGDQVTETRVVTLIGSWQATPVRYTEGEDATVRELPRGVQSDGRSVVVKPAFQTYWRSLDLALFALGALCYFLTALIAGARWWWLLRVNGTDVSLWETLRFTWIGIFFNTVMPGAVGGDVIKALYIMKRCPGHRVQVMVSVIVDRVLGLGSLALLAAIAVLFALDGFKEIAIVIWAVIGGVGLLGVVAFSKRLRNLVRLTWFLNRLPARLGHLLRLVDQAVFFYRDHKWVISASLVAGIGNHVLSVASVLFVGEALGIGMPPFEYFVLVPVINIATAVPAAPNGLGVREFMFQNLFGTYGAPHLTGLPAATANEVMGTRGLALSLLYTCHLYLWSLLGGLFVLFEKDRVTQADIDREAELEAKEDGVEPPAQRG